jgi:plastocyanin
MDHTAVTTTPDVAPAAEGASRGTTLAALGFAMAAVGPILIILAGLVFGMDTEDLTFFIIPTVLGLVGTYLVRRRSTVAKAFSIVIALGIGMLLFWTAFGLAIPSSFFDFVPGILVLPGALLAIGGTITALASRSRASGAGERRAALAIVTLVGLLGGLSAVLTLTGRDSVPDAVADEADVVVDLKEFEFDESAYEVPAGGTVLVKNDDPFAHTFTVDDLDIDVDMGPGDEKVIEIPDDPGTFVLYCKPHTEDSDDPGEDDMASEITVG